MKVGVEVQNEEQSLYPEFEVDGVVFPLSRHPTTLSKTMLNASFANFNLILIRFV